MKLKICGTRDPDNLREMVALKPDFIGFIFYEKSPRFVGHDFSEDLVREISGSVKKVGVFVNSSPDYIINTVKRYDLQYVQLHGNELPDFCRSLRHKGINIIKAFAVDNTFNFAMLNNYKPFCDLFLFDTKTDLPGGSGLAFDWGILRNYENDKPFLLSGGISLDTIDRLLQLAQTMSLYGIDINSKFELEPGVKDLEAVKELMDKIRTEKKEEIQV